MLKYCGYEDFIKDDSHSFIDKIRAITNQNREDDATNQINYISEEI